MDVLLILALVLFNGFFSMAEFAVVSSRKSKLKQLAAEGDKKAKVALKLVERPNTFLSSIQIGITLVTVLVGAVGEDRFASKLAAVMSPIPVVGVFGQEIAFVLVISCVTYISIVLGELVPKRLALNNPEKIAMLVSPFMNAFAYITSPIVRTLSISTEMVFKIIGLKPETNLRITEDEIRVLIREGADMGIFSKTENRLIERALILDDLRVKLLMTPKHKMLSVNIEDFIGDPKRYLLRYPHSRLILTEGEEDKIFGVIHVKDLIGCLQEAGCPEIENLRKVAHKPHVIPESMKAIKVLEMFRRSPVHMALVLDEFGSIQGIVTLNDILEALVGEITSQSDSGADIIGREDGSLLIDGEVTVFELKKKLRLQKTDLKNLGTYQTVAGFVLAHLDKIPKSGDYFEKFGYRFEVIDMDFNRVDKVLVKRDGHQHI